MAGGSGNNDDKVSQFQAVTGLEDSALCAEILQRFSWDLDQAVGAMVGDGDHDELFARSSEIDNHDSAHEAHGSSDSALLQANDGMSLDGIGGDGRSRDGMPHGFSPDHHNRIGERENMLPHEPTNADQHIVRHQGGPGLTWRIATLPFSAIRGSFNVMHGAIGLGMWIAGGILTHSLGALGLAGQQPRVEQRDDGASPLLPLPQGVAEARDFIRSFEREYGTHHPAFQELSFLEALRRANEEFRFLLVYIHSPDHEHTPLFVQQTLCSELVVDFINSNFVIWGGSIRANEGFRMSNTLKASTFPFCAVVMASSNQRVTLLQQLEGPRSSENLVSVLQKVLDEHGTALQAARIQEQERHINRRLRDEQDVAYQAALQADQEREQRLREEAERVALEAEEAERKRKEEEEAAARAVREAAERQAEMERRKQEKAMALGPEPEKGPDVTEVLIRFPNGERGGRRFPASATVSSIYDYVDSLPSFETTSYKLVSNFPRVVYGEDKLQLTLKEAELHPRASLYIQIEDE